MKTVYRYDLELTDLQAVAMPRGAQLLHVARQTRVPGGLSLWALVNPEAEPVVRTIQLAGTGNAEVPEDAIFISTYQESSGFVWHFFDRGEVV